MIAVKFLTALAFLLLPNFLLAAEEKPPIKCEDLRTREIVVNGRTYTKYEVVDPGYLKCVPAQPEAPWIVRKTQWTADDEARFGDFLKSIGRSNCNTVDSCLSGPMNPYLSELDLVGTHYADCADFPFYLRAYFAFKNGLPYAYTNIFEQAPLLQEQAEAVELERQRIMQQTPDKMTEFEDRQKDKRYSRNGNVTLQKYFIPASNGASRDFFRVGSSINNMISSGTLRMLKSPEGKPLPDFYSPAIQPSSIRPGTVLYNVAGHVSIVYDVSANGDVYYIDSHPDNSVSRGFFNNKFRVLRSTYGGNFKNFRPFYLENVKRDPKDPSRITSATFRFYRDEEIPDYSLEQYEGTGPAQVPGQNQNAVYTYPLNQREYSFDFYEWVKLRLSGGTFRLRPEAEMTREMNGLCQDVRDRLDAVAKAIDNRISLRPHPARLPGNIYGADGEWESYSTPGRDIRLKERILNIANAAKDWMNKSRNGYPLIDFRGANLKSEILRTYHSGIWRCRLSYPNSQGTYVPLSLALLIDRVTQLSYDPYACVERRFGATSQAELATCTDNAEKAEWHVLQQFLRNTVDKDNLATHGQSLEELRQQTQSGRINNKDNGARFKLIDLLKGL